MVDDGKTTKRRGVWDTGALLLQGRSYVYYMARATLLEHDRRLMGSWRNLHKGVWVEGCVWATGGRTGVGVGPGDVGEGVGVGDGRVDRPGVGREQGSGAICGWRKPGLGRAEDSTCT